MVRIPKIRNGALKETVNAVATRVGQKEVDKKWRRSDTPCRNEQIFQTLLTMDDDTNSKVTQLVYLPTK